MERTKVQNRHNIIVYAPYRCVAFIMRFIGVKFFIGNQVNMQ